MSVIKAYGHPFNLGYDYKNNDLKHKNDVLPNNCYLKHCLTDNENQLMENIIEAINVHDESNYSLKTCSEIRFLSRDVLNHEITYKFDVYLHPNISSDVILPLEFHLFRLEDDYQCFDLSMGFLIQGDIIIHLYNK